MLKTIFVHIGPPKTGTTSLQRTFRANAGLLEKHGLFYYAGYPNHHPIARYLHKASRRSKDRRHCDDFAKAVASSRCEAALFSSELMVVLTPPEIEEAARYFSQMAERAVYLAYARHPVAHAVSAAHQALRAGKPLELIEAEPTMRRIPRVLKRWTDVVGRDNMIVRPFDRSQLVAGDVVDDALTVLGHADLAPALTRVRANESLSVLAVHLIDRINRRVEERRFKAPYLKVLSGIDGPRYVLPEASLRKVAQKTASDLDYLREEWGVSLSDPKITPSPPLALREEELETLADAIFELLQRGKRRGSRRFLRSVGSSLAQLLPGARRGERDDELAEW